MSLTPLFMFAIPRRAPSIGADGLPAPDSLDIDDARSRAVRAMLGQLRPASDGSGFYFYSGMKGRVLESALVLHILQKNRIDPGWQDRLKAYLAENTDSADLFSATVARTVHRDLLRDGAIESVHSFGLNRMIGALQYAKNRKRVLLGTILAEVGAIAFEGVAINPDRCADEASHLFSRLYMASMRIIYHRRLRTGADLGREIAFLTEEESENGGWEQQALITIAALLALGPRHPSFEKGLSFLDSLTREDGGVAFCDNLNLWTTSLAGIALLNSEEVKPQVLRRIADYVVSRQQEGGGWAFSEGVKQADTDTSAQCAQMLLQLDANRYAEPISRAQGYFLRLHRPDGGYPTYELAGDSEVTMTANVVLVQALGLEQKPALRASIPAALEFIRNRQSADGTFERSWSLCETYSIFRVNLAMNGCRAFDDASASAETQKRSLGYLLANQHDDGGWGQTSNKPSDALSTSYALMSLALLRRQVPRERMDMGLRFLLSQQHDLSGEFVSIPDVVGPRPIVFDIPLLATTFPVMALRIVEQL